jgi:Cu+-exporting ATPase
MIRCHNDLMGAAAQTFRTDTTDLAVEGMTCANCVRHVTEAIQRVDGVSHTTVSLDPGRATVKWKHDARPDVSALIGAIAKAGYQAEMPHTGDQTTHHLSDWQFTVWVGVLCTVPLMIGEWALGLATHRWFQWLSFILAAIVQIVCGARFYRGAWKQLMVGSSNMDTLVALGSTTAYGYSLWALFAQPDTHLYFMEAAAIITLVSIGHWMEARVSKRANSSLRALLQLAPATATRRSENGTESAVNVSELMENDLVVLKPGERVPADAVVAEGASSVDESMLTGEPMPVEKAPAAKVFAGTTNLNGRLLVRVIGTGEETALAQIIAAVERAQTSRANIQRLADRVSSVFVPIVVLIAIAAALWWGLSLEHAQAVHHTLGKVLWAAHPPANPVAAACIIAASVLIIACPCAMGLATPVAIMAGVNVASQRGILIRDGVALEKTGEVTTILFDKTGTLTLGKPLVAEHQIYGQAEALELAGSLARHSTHPLSQAIAAKTPGNIEFDHWRELRGFGIEAHKPGHGTLRLGSLKWLDQNGIDLRAAKDFATRWFDSGATVIGLSLDQKLAAAFALTDALKPGVKAIIAALQGQNLQVALVTGDNLRTAASIAKEAGISRDRVFAEIAPEKKAGLVADLQKRGEYVAFVGDGINDAPALEQADLGIAVSRASDIAREAADIVLLKSEIDAVPESIGLARATLRTIRQNLFWAFFYNAAAVPLAVLGFMTPVLCAAAMGLSDLVVIGNALRLRRWKFRR